ncbi:multicopper oxidase family protein [Pseudorhodoplanes sinuspersici]|nr:multicopper oxidase family protein [Pseudorhodoplanes sinuspersici]RKE73306.1 FtsP/CotA-like multicopper oxidase with cupredoxin domain [Pseudorhodoplanes sinuspersici]
MKVPFFQKSLTRRAFVSAASLSATVTILGGSRAVSQAMAQAEAIAELRAKAGSVRLRGPQQPATNIMGYGGTVPGPTVRLRRGQEFTARLINDGAEPTTIHWHGLRVPNAMDGTPYLTQLPVAPVQSFDYRFVAKDAGTFWYHAALAGQLARGLYGPVIVDESEPVDVDHDVLLVLDDWNLDDNGSLRDIGGSAASGQHFLFTANGLRDLAIPARRGERIRLRLINATVNRLLPVSLSNQTAWVVAIDGQPAEPFIARDSQVVIAPGNRIDLFVDIAEDVGDTVPIVIDSGGGQSVQIARFAIEGGASRNGSRGAPKSLPQNPLPSRIDLRNALRVQLALGAAPLPAKPSVERKKISNPKTNNQGTNVSWMPMDQLSSSLGAPLFSVRKDQPVVLTFANPGDQAYVIHVHGHTFRLLDNLDDGWKPFWLDTLLVGPQQTARIAFVADLTGKWAIERRSLSEPSRESLTWFEVS